jgi:hypothetical protein
MAACCSSRKIKPCACPPQFNFDCDCTPPPTALAPINRFGSHFTAGNVSPFTSSGSGTVSAAGPNATRLLCQPPGTAPGTISRALTLNYPSSTTFDFGTDDFSVCLDFKLDQFAVAAGPATNDSALFRIRFTAPVFNANLLFEASLPFAGPNFRVLVVSATDSSGYLPLGPIDLLPHKLKMSAQRSTGTFTFDMDNGNVVQTYTFAPADYPVGGAQPRIEARARNTSINVGSVADVVLDELCVSWGKAAP